MDERKFKVGDCVRVVNKGNGESDSSKYFGQQLWILEIHSVGGRDYIRSYSLFPNGQNVAHGGIWFSSLELVNSSSIEDFEYC